MDSKVFIRLRDKEINIESQEITIEELIFNQNDIEFDFWNETKTDVNTLPYKDFLFFQDDYEVIVRIGEKKGGKASE